MAILAFILGAAVLSGIFLPNDVDAGDEEERDSNVKNQGDDAAEGTFNPLEVALNSVMKQTFEIPIKMPMLEALDDSVENSTGEGLTFFDGFSDEAQGYTDKSFGIAHRYYENEAISDEFTGREGDDVFFVGAG